jgi:hypothetical protein
MIDYRRMDQRRYIYQPYWITSAEMQAVDCDDLVACCFSFPAAKYGNSHIIIEKIACQIIVAIVGGTIVCDVGSYTLATDDVVSGGTITLVDIDEYIPSADITVATPANYHALTGDWITAKLLMTELTPVVIVPADTTVPCIALTLTSDAAITAGKMRVNALISEVPLSEV